MQQRRHPGIRAFAITSSFALIVAACGGGDGGAGSPAASGPAASSPAASTPAESAPAESGGESPSAAAFEFEQLGGSVSVVGSWSGAEQDSFLAMVAPWEEGTGASVEYTGSRDLNQFITTGIAGGNLPDVAGLPGPTTMRDFYDQGALKPLDFVDFAGYQSATPPGFAELGQAEDGKLVGIFTKATVKGLIWFNPANWTAGEPETWEALNTAAGEAASGDTKQWCVGLESGGDSGWPGTDWIEDIVLRQAGPDVYDAWVRGEQTWSSPEIRAAFETFGQVLQNTAGDPVNTSFQTGGNGLFSDPPACLLHHQASFITDFFKNEAGADEGDYDFFMMPDIDEQYAGALIGGGDLVGMFNDTPQAQSLIRWLLSPEAQQIWAERGGFISANRNISVDIYPDDVSKRTAEILNGAQAVRYDASDQFPAQMNRGFFTAIVEFAQNPGNLDSILATLDQVQQEAYSE